KPKPSPKPREADEIDFEQNAGSWNGGEGGIRTPRTLIRGTHDFQSCTFNPSGTSPAKEINYLVSLPCSANTNSVQNVSTELFWVAFLSVLLNYHSKMSVAKSKN